eukprot:5969262-Amphidinium_carterae.1
MLKSISNFCMRAFFALKTVRHNAKPSTLKVRGAPTGRVVPQGGVTWPLRKVSSIAQKWKAPGC